MIENSGMKNGGGTDVAIPVGQFEYLSGNVKGRFEHQLTSRCVAFLGPNRAGKTARLDAIQIALTGKHPVGPHGTDLFELAPENALTFHQVLRGPDGLKSEFKVEVEGGKPKKPPEKPERGGALKAIELLPDSDKLFENMMPTLTMRDLIRGSTLTREAVFRRWGKITALPTPRGLTEEQLGIWSKTADEAKKAKPKADTAAVLSEMSRLFRTKKLAAGDSVKALEKLVKDREATLVPAAAGAENLPALKKQLALADAFESTAGLRARKAEIEAEAEAYRAKVKPYIEADKIRAQKDAEVADQDRAKAATVAELAKQIEDFVVQQRSLEAEVARQLAELDAATNAARSTIERTYAEKLKDQLEMLHGGRWLLKNIAIMHAKKDADGHASCVLCANSVDVAALEAQVAPRVEARAKSVAELEKERDAEIAASQKKHAEMTAKVKKAGEETVARTTAARAAAITAHAKAEADYKAWKSVVEAERRKVEDEKNTLRQEFARIKSAQEENKLALDEAYKKVTAAREGEATTELPEKYEGPSSADLRATIKALEDAETANRQLDAEVGKLRQLELDRQLYKLLEQEATRELNGLLTRTADTANEAVNRYMPAGFKAVLDVEEAQWQVIGTDGRAHGKKVASGSEMGALVVALSLAWTEGAPARYVRLDDEDIAFFDAETLPHVLRALKAATIDGRLHGVYIGWSRAHEIPDDWGQKIYISAPVPTFVAPPAASTITPTTPSPSPVLL